MRIGWLCVISPASASSICLTCLAVLGARWRCMLHAMQTLVRHCAMTATWTCPPPPAPQPASAFHAVYHVDSHVEVGRGSHSVVLRGTRKKPHNHGDGGPCVAVKVVDGRGLTGEDEAALRSEVALLAALRHPNVVLFEGFFHDVELGRFFVVMEFMDGGELFNRIVAKEFYSEGDALTVVRTLAGCLKFLHDRHVVHRDLKPENILLSASNLDDATKLKVADFGFAKVVSPEGQRTTCGTPGYLAPEILLGRPYGVSVDVWSLGVIMYILLCGYPPFYNSNQNLLFRSIREGKVEFNPLYWKDVSDCAKDLIRAMLRVDVHRRFTIDNVLAHPWITGGTNTSPQVDLASARVELKKFNARRKLRAGIRAALAAQRFTDLLKAVPTTPRRALAASFLEPLKVEAAPPSPPYLAFAMLALGVAVMVANYYGYLAQS